MKKYAISREFFPWYLFAPPISEKFLTMSVSHMKPPKFLWRDKELDVATHEIISYDGECITCFVLCPKNLPEKVPCLLPILKQRSLTVSTMTVFFMLISCRRQASQ